MKNVIALLFIMLGATQSSVVPSCSSHAEADEEAAGLNDDHSLLQVSQLNQGAKAHAQVHRSMADVGVYMNGDCSGAGMVVEKIDPDQPISDGCITKASALTGALSSVNYVCDGPNLKENVFDGPGCTGSITDVKDMTKDQLLTTFSGQCYGSGTISVKLTAGLKNLGNLALDCPAAASLAQARVHRSISDVGVYMNGNCSGAGTVVEKIDPDQPISDGCITKASAFTGALSSVNYVCDGPNLKENVFDGPGCTGSITDVKDMTKDQLLTTFSGQCYASGTISVKLTAGLKNLGNLALDCP